MTGTENLNVSLSFTPRNIEVAGKQNSLFPAGLVIKCFVIPPNTKLARPDHVRVQSSCCFPG